MKGEQRITKDGGIALAGERQAITELVKALGERRAAERLNVTPQVLARVLGGLPVRRGNLALLRGGLAQAQLEA
jgi:hypothetical protein